MSLSDSPMAKMMYRHALMNLSNGIVTPIDKDILSSTPLPDNFITPYLSEKSDALTVMNLGFNSLSTWIEEAKKASYFSKHFVTLSRMIMSGVATMARGLVSLHTLGENLSQAPMSIQDLISVGSYHIRKSYLGVLQTSRKNPEIGEHLLLNQLSWTNTLLRLFKTREKLQTESSKSSKCKDQSSNLDGACVSSGSELPVRNDVEAFEPFESSDSALAPVSALTAPGAYTAPRAYTSFGNNTQRAKKKTTALPEANTSLPVANEGSFDAGEAPASENISHTVKQNTEESKETDSDDADSSASEEERSCENESLEFSPDAPTYSGHQGFSQREGTGKPPDLDPDHPPDYRQILYRAAERSEGTEDGSITFTKTEVILLLSDPVFCSREPELAQDIRQELLYYQTE